jgi:DNA topoisomerase-3
MKQLIITEKPSVARDIVKSLGGFRQDKESFESDEIIVTWAVGHLVTLAEPEDYDKKYKMWLLERLPIIPEQFQLKVLPKTNSRFKFIGALLKSKEVGEVINACDAGREGELIFRYIYEKAGSKLPIRRLWLSSMTETAIQEGFRHLRPGQELEKLASAAKCRSESDWLVGINATRAFTRRFGILLSIGRVQTPTLAILVQREQEIQLFSPETYFELYAAFQSTVGEYRGQWFTKGADRFSTRSTAEEIQKKVEGKPGIIASLEKKESRQLPPLLFDLAELQREMNRRHGYSARRTLDLAQSLYEEHKLITYPRTDSQFLGSDMIAQLPQILRSLAGGEWDQFVQEVLALPKLPLGPRMIDNSKVTDHHAIIPTPTRSVLAKLAADELRVYDLVVRRFLSAFYPAARWENTRLVTEVEQETFRTEGKKLLEIGWLKVYDRPSKDELLPDLSLAERIRTLSTTVLEKETQPPPRYNDATLLSAMEGAGKLLEDEALKQAMKDHGLGTAATRAAIIERLIEVEYLERDGKSLRPTPKGMELIKSIAAIPIPELISPELTGNWEQNLVLIEQGKLSAETFMTEIEQLARSVVEKVKTTENTATMREAVYAVLAPCPLCNGDIKEFRQAFSCANWREKGCKFAIWKRVAGRTISRREAETLIRDGRIGPLAGFRSKAGKSFRAILVLKDGKVTFEFENTYPASSKRVKRAKTPSKPKEDGSIKKKVSARPTRMKTSASSTPKSTKTRPKPKEDGSIKKKVSARPTRMKTSASSTPKSTKTRSRKATGA